MTEKAFFYTMTDLEAEEDIKSLGRERLLQIFGDTDVNKRMKVTELRALCRTKFPNPRKKKRAVREWATPDRSGEQSDTGASAEAPAPPIPPFPVAPQGPANPFMASSQHREQCGSPLIDDVEPVAAPLAHTPVSDDPAASVSGFPAAPEGASPTSVALSQHREYGASAGDSKLLEEAVITVAADSSLQCPPCLPASQTANASESHPVQEFLGGGLGDASEIGRVQAPSVIKWPTWSMRGASESESVIPGSPEDLHVPVQNKKDGEPVAKHVWFFFRRRYSHEALRKKDPEKHPPGAWCMLSPCGGDKFVPADGTRNLQVHLERHHGLNMELQLKQAEGRCTCGCNGKLHDGTHSRALVLAEAKVNAQKTAADKLSRQAEGQLGVKQDAAMNFTLLRPLDRVPQAYVSKQFARLVCVGGLWEGTLIADPAFKAWVQVLLGSCHADCIWQPPERQLVYKTLADDTLRMWAMAQTMYQAILPTTRSDHHDCWTDKWKRHWVCAYSTWLDENFQRHFFVYCIRTTGQLTSHLHNATGGTQAADVVANTISRAWRDKFTAGMSKWGHSDNATPAVAVTHNLGMAEERCTAHSTVINISRTLTPVQVAPDRVSAPPLPPCPDELEAMNVGQNQGLFYYHHEERQQMFVKFRKQLGLTAQEAPLPKPYAAKWNSKLLLAATMSKSRRVLEEIQKNRHALAWTLPTLPSVAQFGLYAQIEQVLGPVEALVAQLQADEAPLAIYVPMAAAFKGVLEDLQAAGCSYAKQFLKEFEDTEHRHFDVEGVCGNWKTQRELMETAALAHPQYRQGLYIKDLAVRTERRHRFQKHMLTMYMRANNLTDANVTVGSSPVPKTTNAAQKPTKVALPGADALFQKVSCMNNFAPHRVAASANAQAAEGNAQAAEPNRTLKEEIVHLADAWFASDPDPTPLCEYFSDAKVKRTFRLLLPGLRSLLMHQASNGTIERIFSKLSHLLNKFCKNLNPEGKLCLNINSRYMKMDGYEQRFELQPDSDDDIDTFEGSFYDAFEA